MLTWKTCHQSSKQNGGSWVTDLYKWQILSSTKLYSKFYTTSHTWFVEEEPGPVQNILSWMTMKSFSRCRGKSNPKSPLQLEKNSEFTVTGEDALTVEQQISR